MNESAHPDQLFEYLNGSADVGAAKAIAAHLFVCQDCASVTAVVRGLKEAASGLQSETPSDDPITNPQSQASDLRFRTAEWHPNTSELGSFFYAQPEQAANSRVATHVALCKSCVDEIAEYARADRTATEYMPETTVTRAVPHKTWELIRDWEESSFAVPKVASEVLGQEMLNRLFSLLDKRGEQGSEMEHAVTGSQSSAGQVPVLVVSSSGEVRSVELFESLVDTTGAAVLKHAEGSQRFDRRVIHALLDYGEKDPVLISDLIESDTLRQHAVREEKTPRRVDYFIIEESWE